MSVSRIVSLLLLLVLTLGMEQFGSDVAVTYGSIVRIVNPLTAYMYPPCHLVCTRTMSSSAEEE